MFTKRCGVLKTKDMMKKLDGCDIDERLRVLIGQNNVRTEEFQRIEDLCKNALRKAMVVGGDQLEFADKAYADKTAINRDGSVGLVLKNLGIEFEDWSCNIVYHALFDKDRSAVVFLPKKYRDDVNKLYTAAKNEKRRLKLAHKKIVNALKQRKGLLAKMETIVSKIKSDEVVKGLSFDNEKNEVHRDSPGFKKFSRYKKEYDNLVAKMCDIKSDIRGLIISCGFSKEAANQVYDSMTYPQFDVEELREIKEKNN